MTHSFPTRRSSDLWDNLSPAARAERSSSKRLEFEQMSLTQQSALKARIAERRARAGLDELDQYCAWLRSIPADEFVARSLDRKRSEEHTSELQSLMRISYAVLCLKKTTHTK